MSTGMGIRRGGLLFASIMSLTAMLPLTALADAGVKAVETVAPVYPAAAARTNQEGWVELEFIVDTSGTVKNISIVNSQPERLFDAAAVKALRQWKFTPAEKGGAAIEAQVRQRIDFKL